MRRSLDTGVNFRRASQQALVNPTDDRPLNSSLSLRRSSSIVDRGADSSRTLGKKRLIKQVLRIVNKKRSKAGLKPLSLSSKLNKSAQAHSKDMAVNDFFSHTGSNGSSFGERIRKTGYSYSAAAENIAAGSSTAKGVMKQWMRSSGHRANILSPNVTQLGVGYYFQPNDGGNAPWGHYWTQNFAKPWR